MNPNNTPDSTTPSLPNTLGNTMPVPQVSPLPIPGKPMHSAIGQADTSLQPTIPAPVLPLANGPDPLQINDDNITSLDEESWILRTKQVVAQFQEDPFALTEELYKVRAQFMQDVHGKELKQKDEGR